MNVKEAFLTRSVVVLFLYVIAWSMMKMKKVKVTLCIRDRIALVKDYCKTGYEMDCIMKNKAFAQREFLRKVWNVIWPKQMIAYLKNEND